MKRAGQFSIRALFAVTGVMAVAIVAHRQVYLGSPVLRVVAWSVPAMLVILCHGEIQRLLDRIPAMIAGKPLSALAPMEEKPKRRWLSFSVRTLLIAVTVFCVWLGWQASVVRERRELLNLASSMTVSVTRVPVHMVSLSWIRRLLGDVYVEEITFLDEEGTVAARESIIRAFPEAMIRTVQGRHHRGPIFSRPPI